MVLVGLRRLGSAHFVKSELLGRHLLLLVDKVLDHFEGSVLEFAWAIVANVKF